MSVSEQYFFRPPVNEDRGWARMHLNFIRATRAVM